MGRIAQAFGIEDKPLLKAERSPRIMGDQFSSMYSYAAPSIVRNDAMSVPSLARCRSLICNTIASFPFNLYRNSTGEELGNPVWLDQPSVSQPRSVTIAWTVDSLFMFGVAYWEVTEVYVEDNRPARFQWVPNNRVTFNVNRMLTQIDAYFIDGFERPQSGIGSVVTFQSFDEGILARGASTIRAAIDTQEAARIAASTPMPTGVLKNSGADLPEKEVAGLLAAWKSSRMQRSTAYLTSTLSYDTIGFSPKDMLYTEAIQNLATEISRLCNVDAFYLSADANNSMTYSNLLDSRKQFVSLTLQPYISQIEDRLSMNDITANGNYVRFDLDHNFLRQEPLTELAILEKLLALELITKDQAMRMTELTPNGMAE